MSRKARTVLVAVGLSLAISCTPLPTPSGRPPEIVEPPNRIHAFAFSADGSRLVYAEGSATCRVAELSVDGGEATLVRELPFCPERLETFEDGGFLAAGVDQSVWITADGTDRFEGRTILAAEGDTRFLEQTGNELVWQDGENSIALAAVSIRAPRITSGGTLLAIESIGEVERIVRFDDSSPTPITPEFRSIDSYDIAPRGKELVFSAHVESGFDIGIVSVSGGEISWVAPEPADEVNVTWAPRGNKITYAFESVAATLVRSVHVPSSFQVMFELPLTAVRGVAWEPRAEKIAIVIESGDRGPRIDWVGYNGEGRASLVPARETIETPVENALWSGGSGVLLGPSTIRYDETGPMVVWIDRGETFGWRPEVARIRQAGIPVLVTEKSRIGDLAVATSEMPWVDPASLYVVDVPGIGNDQTSTFESATWLVRSDSPQTDSRRTVEIAGSDEWFRVEAARRIIEDTKADR